MNSKLMIVLLGIALCGFTVPLVADTPAVSDTQSLIGFPPALPADAGEVVIGFLGGSTWTGPTTGICQWYLPLVGKIDPADLAKDPNNPATAYLFWSTDWTAATPPPFGGPFLSTNDFTVARLNPGTATIYYSSTGANSVGEGDATHGDAVAVFRRGGGLIVSATPDFSADTVIFSADLVWSKPFTLNGKLFDFRNLIPRGMTCYETGKNGSSSEAGACIANGDQR